MKTLSYIIVNRKASGVPRPFAAEADGRGDGSVTYKYQYYGNRFV
jgi:hypothetical protein